MVVVEGVLVLVPVQQGSMVEVRQSISGVQHDLAVRSAGEGQMLVITWSQTESDQRRGRGGRRLRVSG